MKAKHLTFLFSLVLFFNVAYASNNPPCTNILENPGFENDLTGWTLTGTGGLSDEAMSGNSAAEICGSGYATLGQILTTTPGEEYRALIRGKVQGQPGLVFTIRFLDLNYSPIQVSGQDLSGGTIRSSSYVEEEIYATAPTGAVYVHLLFWKENEGCFIVDDLELCSGIPQPDTWARINCHYDIVVEVEPGQNGALVEYYGLSSATITECLPHNGFIQIEGLPTNSFFPIGTTVNCFNYTNSCGDVDECCFNVIVEGDPQDLPDLSVEVEIMPYPERGKSTDFTYTINNNGAAFAESHYLILLCHFNQKR